MKKVVILQSNYLPWKGYFDLINDADLFVFYDDLQYTKNDWRNRNKIKTAQGVKWLTVPVGTDLNRLICEVEIKDHSWQKKHWEIIKQSYGKCTFFSRYKSFFESIYLEKEWSNLSIMNQEIIKMISIELLHLDTEFADSREYKIDGKRLDRLIDLVVKTNASHYISGPAAKEYIDSNRFSELDVKLIWKDYSNYPEYPQKYPPFVHGVSILDLIFSVGPDAPSYIWGWREKNITQ